VGRTGRATVRSRYRFPCQPTTQPARPERGAAGAGRLRSGAPAWTTPAGGFYVWLTCPEGVDTVALPAAARAEKVAYVPGRPFYLEAAGVRANQIRLAYSRVADDLIDEGIRRIADVVKSAL
jgi:2-aminoadipate transaminase